MKAFSLRNVKGFVDSGTIELKPITVLVGRNSCGKSTLLRFLSVLKQTDNDGIETEELINGEELVKGGNTALSFYGNNVDYGCFEDVIHNHVGDEFTYTITECVEISNLDILLARKNLWDVKAEVTVISENNRMCINRFGMYIDNVLIFVIETDDKGFGITFFKGVDNVLIDFREHLHIDRRLNCLVLPYVSTQDVVNAMLSMLVYKGELTELNLRRIRGFDRETKYPFSETENAALRKIKLIEQTLSVLRVFTKALDISKRFINYIGPVRSKPERVYRLPEHRMEGVGATGENVGAFLLDGCRVFPELQEIVSRWLYKFSGYKIEIRNLGNNLFQILLVDEKGIRINIADAGYGISQLLPIITQLVYLTEIGAPIKLDTMMWGSDVNILLEQPELHLHPEAQAMLADLLVDAVLNVGSGGQYMSVLVETHSEHLIKQLQSLIDDPENSFTGDMLKIYYVYKDKDGDSMIKDIKPNPQGRLEDGILTTYALQSEMILNCGDEADLFFDWFKPICEQEDCFTIIDAYAFNQFGREIFKEKFLDCFGEGSKIVIYCNTEINGEEITAELMDSIVGGSRFSKFDITVIGVTPGFIHDRFIVSKNWVLDFGKGIQFYNSKTGKVTKSSICFKVFKNMNQIVMPHGRLIYNNHAGAEMDIMS